MATTEKGRRIGRPPACTCESCAACERRRVARERYRSMSQEERRALVARRDAAKARANDRARYRRHTDERLAAQREYAATQQGKAARARGRKKWEAANPEKKAAAMAAGNAVRDGRLVRGACEQKGEGCKGRIEAHHDDYTRPLQVRWLCVKHHRAADAARRQTETA